MNTIAFLPNLGGQELLIVFVIFFLLFGAKQLPKIARGIAQTRGEFKRAQKDFERELKLGEDEGRDA